MPELVPIRYGRMLVSPFTFYRGAAYLMASDLVDDSDARDRWCNCAATRTCRTSASSPPRTGGSSSASTTSTRPCPARSSGTSNGWSTSFEVAGRDRGFDTKQRRTVNLAVLQAYREAMHEMAQMRTMDLWYTRLDIDDIAAQMQEQLNRTQQKRFTRNVAKARTKDSIKAFDKLVRVVDGQPQLVGDPPLIVPIGDLFREQESREVEAAMHEMIRSYRRTLPRRPSAPAGAVPLRGRGPQGGRRRKRRHARLDRADARPRRPGPVVPPGQGGAGVGPRAVPGEEQARQPRPAGGCGAAADAGGQ